MPKAEHVQFQGGQKVLYCAICSVPPEYCEYMDTPAACDEWLEATHPQFFAELKERKRRTTEEREQQIAALEAEKKEAEMAAAMEAEMASGGGDGDDEAAMLAAMEAEMGAEGGEGGGAQAGGDGASKEAGGEAEGAGEAEGGEDGGDKKKKKKRKKTRRGGANNRRQTGILTGTEVQEVVLSRVQRNKRKFVTVILGLESFGHKLKSAAKKLGKRFACGAAVSVNDAGKDEIVIQGDCLSDLPKLLSEKYEVAIADMYVLAKGKKVPLNDLRTS